MNIKSLKCLPCILLIAALSACSREAEPPVGTDQTMQDSGGEETQALVLLRGLPTLGTTNSVAIVEMDPEAENFGDILHEFETPGIDPPLHHIYYSPTGRAYATALDPKCSLVEIGLARDASGSPVINGVECLDIRGQQVGEDIMWHTVNGTEYMFVTFIGGGGVEQEDGGSVGVFDTQSNEIVKIIEARKSVVGEGEPYILYPHGIPTGFPPMVTGWLSRPRSIRIWPPASATPSLSLI